MNVGIDTLKFYIPENRIAISTIMEARKQESQQLYDVLARAQITTAQAYMRIPHLWQDSVCLAAQAALSLITDSSVQEYIPLLRYIISATETPVDAAKPVSAFVLGILNKVCDELPSKLVSYQTQHACAGGLISILQAASLVATTQHARSSALVTTSDIAHYNSHTNAEITQGAGAMAFLITKDPRLLTLDISNVGFSSADVDDFFRPLSSPTAVVKGRYSMRCYIEATFDALEDFAQQTDQSVLEVLESNDYLVFHAPFRSMPSIALTNILKNHLSLDRKIIADMLEKKHFDSVAEIITNIGNTYTSSVFLSFGHILQQQYRSIGKDIIGKKVLLVSYGAGSTAVVMQGILGTQAPEVIEQWNLDEQTEHYTELSMELYDQWCKDSITSIDSLDKSSLRRKEPTVFIKEIREDLYRLYGIA